MIPEDHIVERKRNDGAGQRRAVETTIVGRENIKGVVQSLWAVSYVVPIGLIETATIEIDRTTEQFG